MNQAEKLSQLYVCLSLPEAEQIKNRPEMEKAIIAGNCISEYTLILDEQLYRKVFHKRAENLFVLMQSKEMTEFFDDRSCYDNSIPVFDKKVAESSYMVPVEDYIGQCFPNVRTDTENLLRNTFWNKVQDNFDRIENETDRYGTGHALFMETVNEISEITYVKAFRILFSIYNDEDEEWYDDIRNEELAEFNEKYQ